MHYAASKAVGAVRSVFRNILWISVFIVSWIGIVASAAERHFGMLLAWPLLPVLYWFATFVHELGHAFATILCGWRVTAFAAGPFGINFVNRSFAVIPSAKRPETEGFVLPTPKNSRVFTHARDFWITAGGPVASLLLFLLLLPLGTAEPLVVAQVDLGWIALALGLLSFATFVDTAIPAPVSGRANDGRKMLDDIREADRLNWLAQIYGLLSHQVRLRDLPLWMLEEARLEAGADGDDMLRAFDCLTVGIVLDSPPVDAMKARKLLDDFRSKNVENAWLSSCDAYFTAVWEKDAARAERLLWRGELQPGDAALAWAAQASVYAGLGNCAAARFALTEMRSEVAKTSVFPDLTFRDISRQIEAMIDAQTVERRPEIIAATA